jgi:membrane protease YdiL (CAAX protease family)
MDALVAQHETPANEAVTAAWTFVALAFAISWTAWIVAIKLHAPEWFLNIGSAGPALAAMVVSYRGHADRRPRKLFLRALTFVAVMVLCWIVLSAQHAWRTSPALPGRFNPWLILPAVFPAWVISAVFSKDSGVRGVLQRLVHAPDRWSAFAFLLFPAIILPGALLGHLLHLPLAIPASHGSALQSAAVAVSLFLYNVFFVAALEEPGWRGCLLDRLQLRCSPLGASTLVWLPWALWHAPLDYFRPQPFSLLMYLEVRVIFLIPIVLIMTWLYNRSNRSIQATAMFHAGMNTFPLILPYFMPGFVLLFIVAGYAVYSDRMWRFRPKHDTGGCQLQPVTSSRASST